MKETTDKIINKEIFGKRLLELLEERGENFATLADALHLSTSTISRYANASMEPKWTTILSISEHFNVNPLWLCGSEHAEKYLPKEYFKKVPILGTIAAGKPILAEEHIEGYEYIPYDEGVDFCLRVHGDSMIGARIFDGDIVYIRKQPDVENGEIAAVMVNGYEATIKRVFKANGSIILHPENPEYEDMVFSKKEAENIRILGKVVSFKSVVR
jgi:repressor LexA